jgi:ComF family protein
VLEDAGLRNWRHGLFAAGEALLDLFFPPRCPGCGRVGFTFCGACQARIEPPTAPACIRCGHPTDAEQLCPTCRETPSSLDRIASSAIFAHPLRDAIHELKYNDGRSLARPLGARMAAAWRQGNFAADVIIPVPLHAARLAERGYNQSALLARIVSREVGVPINETALVRAKATQQQATLKALERRKNVEDAFACRGDVAGKNVVLVDDVCTTGSTLEACAAALCAAGAASVWAFTLARARWEPGHAGPAPDADTFQLSPASGGVAVRESA